MQPPGRPRAEFRAAALNSPGLDKIRALLGMGRGKPQAFTVVYDKLEGWMLSSIRIAAHQGPTEPSPADRAGWGARPGAGE